MRIISQIILKGFFRMRVYRKDKLVDVYQVNNRIVTGAFLQMAHLIGGDVEGRSISHIAFGTNGAVPQDADQIITDQFKRPVMGYEVPFPGLVQINWELGKAENNGMGIKELGLLTEDDTLFARISLEQPFPKTSEFSMEGDWTFALSEAAVAFYEENYQGGE